MFLIEKCDGRDRTHTAATAGVECVLGPVFPGFCRRDRARWRSCRSRLRRDLDPGADLRVRVLAVDLVLRGEVAGRLLLRVRVVIATHAMIVVHLGFPLW